MGNRSSLFKDEHIICKRIKERMEELKLSDSEMSIKLYGNDKSRSKVWKWRNGLNTPSPEEIPAIAKVLECTQAYLLGAEDTVIAENQAIHDRIGILDEAIKGLEELKKEQEGYLNCDDEMLKSTYLIYEQGFNYMDIVSHIIGNTDLWRTILYEAERVMSWHLNDNYRNRFELLLNEEGSGYKYPAQVEAKDISSQVIAKAVTKTFNEYISNKLKELKIKELTADEHELKMLPIMKQDNK